MVKTNRFGYAIRKIEGKTFKCYAGGPSKQAVLQSAEKFRKQGYLTRVIPSKDGFLVYIRKRKLSK